VLNATWLAVHTNFRNGRELIRKADCVPNVHFLSLKISKESTFLKYNNFLGFLLKDAELLIDRH